MLLGQKRGCNLVLQDIEGISMNPQKILISKYKKILMATVKAALEILGIGRAEKIESGIFNIVS